MILGNFGFSYVRHWWHQRAWDKKDKPEAIQERKEKTMVDESMKMSSGRETYWSELDIEGRIERTRMEVKRMQHLLEEVLKLFEQLRHHVHVEGDIAYKSSSSGVERFSRVSDPSRKDVYF